MIDSASLAEFKAICADMGHDLSDEEAKDAAERVIRFLLATEPDLAVRLSDHEQTVLDMVKAGPPPSVREVSQKLGFSSSRSGHNVVALFRKVLYAATRTGNWSFADIFAAPGKPRRLPPAPTPAIISNVALQRQIFLSHFAAASAERTSAH